MYRQNVIRCIFLVVTLFLSVAGQCVHAKDHSANQTTARPLKIVASFSVLADLVKNVCREHGEVVSLVGYNSDAHVYEPKPVDAKTIADADIIFVNGFNFEGWMSRLIEAADTHAPIYVAAEGIVPLPSSDVDPNPDPHMWASPIRANMYIKNIRNALCEIDPEHAADYRKNAREIREKLKDLINWTNHELAKVPPKFRKVITVHDGFNYLGKDFNIKFKAPIGVDTKAEVSAKAMAKLIRQIREYDIRAIFVENITNPHLIEQIAEEAGVPVGGKIYSDALSEPGGEASTYLDMVRHNITSIVTLLQRGLATFEANQKTLAPVEE